MLIRKGGIYRQIDPKRLQQYRDKGYAAVEESPKAFDRLRAVMNDRRKPCSAQKRRNSGTAPLTG